MCTCCFAIIHQGMSCSEVCSSQQLHGHQRSHTNCSLRKEKLAFLNGISDFSMEAMITGAFYELCFPVITSCECECKWAWARQILWLSAFFCRAPRVFSTLMNPTFKRQCQQTIDFIIHLKAKVPHYLSISAFYGNDNILYLGDS